MRISTNNNNKTCKRHQTDHLTSTLTVSVSPVVALFPTDPRPQLGLLAVGDISASRLGRGWGLSPGCRPGVIASPRKHSQGGGGGVGLVRWVALRGAFV